MSLLQNNFWKLLFVIIVCAVAYIGYKSKHTSVATAVVEERAQEVASAGLSKDDIEDIVKEFILNNPNVIIKSMELMQQRKMKEMEDEIDKVIKEKRSDLEDITKSPYAGNKNGDITIVTFGDATCAYCKKSNEALNQLLSSDVGVKVLYMTFPILGDASEYASKILLAVYKTAPEKFKPVQDGIMDLKSLTKDDVKNIVTQNGLDMSNLEIEMDKPEVKDMQVRIMGFARDLRIQGAPASIINGSFYPGLLDINKLKEVVATERSKKK